MPDCPDDIDSLISWVKDNQHSLRKWNQQDLETINKMLDAMRDGAKGAILIQKPHGVEFMLVNADRIEGIQLFTECIRQNAAHLK